MIDKKHLLFILGIVLVFLGLILPQSASAQRGGYNGYGPWFPAPGNGGSGQVAYQANIQPFNDTHISEISNFSCVLPGGRPLTGPTQAILSQIFELSTKVYAGQLEANDFGSSKGKTGEVTNLGFPNGKAGMQMWLQQMKRLLTSGGSDGALYSAPENVTVREAGFEEDGIGITDSGIDVIGKLTGDGDGNVTFTSPNGKIEFDWDEDKSDSYGANKRHTAAALLNGGATTPLGLSANLPQGCTLDALDDDFDISFGSLFSDFGGTVTDLIFFIPNKITSGIYNVIAPLAFKYTFWTPHSERGDTLWSVPDSCAPDASSTFNRRQSMRQIADGCTAGVGSQPLGFSKRKTRVQAQGSWYLNIATFIQWLVSATYFLVLFTAAVLYIFRGNRNTSLNLMTFLPRLVLSIILTIFSGFLIGALISFSNLLVQSIFGTNAVWTVGAVNTFLLQSGSIVGGGEFVERLVQVVVGIAVVWFFILFIVGSVLRQIGLIVLVVLAPLAIFCIVNDRWKINFDKWVRALLAVCFTPAIMALIFKIGMSINPLINDPRGSYGSLNGLLGLLLMLVTLWAMTRVLKSAKNFINVPGGNMPLPSWNRNKGTDLDTEPYSGGGSGGGRGWSGSGGGSGGGGWSGGGGSSGGGGWSGGGGALIPSGKATASAGGGSRRAAGGALPVGGLAAAKATGLPDVHAAASSAVGMTADKISSGVENWAQRRKSAVAARSQQRKSASIAQQGMRPISEQDYFNLQARRKAAIEAGLDPEAVLGGKAVQQDGQYYFQHTAAGEKARAQRHGIAPGTTNNNRKQPETAPGAVRPSPGQNATGAGGISNSGSKAQKPMSQSQAAANNSMARKMAHSIEAQSKGRDTSRLQGNAGAVPSNPSGNGPVVNDGAASKPPAGQRPPQPKAPQRKPQAQAKPITKDDVTSKEELEQIWNASK